MPSRGLEHARGLRHLICFGPLESNVLPTVETLSVDLDGAGAQRLPALVAPRLSALHTRVAAQDEALLLESLAHAPWFAELQTWTHRVAATKSLAALLANGPLVARGGAGLQLLCDEPVLKAITDALRHALPRATFTLLPTPKRPHDEEEEAHGPAVTCVVPRQAPMDFRERPPSGQVFSHSVQTDGPVPTTLGSGFPLGPYRFSTCSWCGSGNTLGIASETWSLYSRKRSETTTYAHWEYECHDCGLFTKMYSARIRS